MRRPTNEWILDHPAFDHLLDWLDGNDHVAARKYEEIRRRLMKFFERRGCSSSDEQVDRVIDRVARRLTEGARIYAMSPYQYFAGVARNVFYEYLRQRRLTLTDVPAIVPDDSAWSQRRMECMERCWSLVSPQTRQMMIDYCSVDKAAKRREREALAARHGLSLNSLRIRVHRVRLALERSLAICLSTPDRNERERQVRIVD
jgi:DNA-directed RNA polymerase specialized sigma24 family protein